MKDANAQLAKAGNPGRCTKVSLDSKSSENREFVGIVEYSDGTKSDVTLTFDPAKNETTIQYRHY